MSEVWLLSEIMRLKREKERIELLLFALAHNPCQEKEAVKVLDDS